MPRVNIYLNNKDYTTWSTIINKSAFVSMALKNKPSEYCSHGNVWGFCSRGCERTVGASVSEQSEAPLGEPQAKPRLSGSTKDSPPNDEQQPTTRGMDTAFKKDYTTKVCKNGHLLGANGKCLQKGCKYA